jgi:homoserine O-acetyltransferase/O-succinyltransferase
VSESSTSFHPPGQDPGAALDGAADPSSLDPALALRPVSLPDGYVCEEGILALERPFRLFHGGELPRVEIAYRLAGARDMPVVAVLGGISAGRNVFRVREAVAGWWDEIAGPGRALDTNAFRVLGIDFLGGSHQTTGPAHGEVFPSVSAHDQVACLLAVMDHLGIERLHGCIGASYGGMVTMVMAATRPQRLRHGIVMSAAHRTHPMSTAWRSVQRNFVRYAIGHGEGEQGLALARSLAMTTYRSIREFEERFPGEAAREAGQFVFPVEAYILARGAAYAKTYRPEAFVCLSESIDLHRLEPESITVPLTMVAVLEDQLVPVADMRALRDRCGSTCQLIEISSMYGHDAFFKEADVLRDVFHRTLD